MKQRLNIIVTGIIISLVMMTIGRIMFFTENYNIFHELKIEELLTIFYGGLHFDWYVVCIINSLFVILALFTPLTNKKWNLICKYFFIISNSICWIANACDCVYFKFIGRRTTATVFSEFADDNLSDIFMLELYRHWYLVLAVALQIAIAWWIYSIINKKEYTKCNIKYKLLALAIWIIITIGAIRGGFDPEIHPINLRDAKEYINTPRQAALVLNTPFSIIRTINKKPIPEYKYFDSKTLDSIYSPLHKDSITTNRHDNDVETFHIIASRNSMVAEGGCEKCRRERSDNVMIIILESFGSEYSALLNKDAKGNGYMPFLDSLMQESMTFEYSFSNGRSSVDGQASILSSIPMFVESFFTSHAAMNSISGVASELKKDGYNSYFFHGADNGSLDIDGFTKSVGFDNYFGRNEYGNDNDWDHHWGIWDEPFLQYVATTLSKAKQPFISSVFTLTSHHPFHIPEKYKKIYPESSLEIHKCIRYTDMSLKRFFDTAKKQPWYNNTLFVITGDHVNLNEYPYYSTDIGVFQVPILLYHPTDQRFKGKHKGIIQHIDIMPTILGFTGHKKPYIAFGEDILNTPSEETFMVNYQNGIYLYVEGHWLLEFDGDNIIAFYDYEKDRMLKNNLVNSASLKSKMLNMEKKLKAIIQSYSERMNGNDLVI